MKKLLLFTVTLFLGNLIVAQELKQLGSDLNGNTSGTQFGKAISLNQDGTIAAIGAPSGDLVQVFEWNAGTSTWNQMGADISGEASGDQFGEALELSADGQLLAVGAPLNGSGNGHVRIMEWDSTTWVQKGSDINGVHSGNESGTSLGVSEDGSTVIIGAPKRGSSGAAKVFEWDTNTSDWVQKGSNLFGESSNDQFGLVVSINTDGSVIAGATRLNDGNGTSSGHVRIFEWDTTASDWVQKGSDIDGDAFGDDSGISADLSSDGLTVAIGARRNDGGGTNSGHVRVFEWDGNTSWVQKGGDIDGDFAEERLGISLSIDGAGNTLVIGSPESDASDTNPGTDRGEAKIFKWNADNSQWNQIGVDIDGIGANANFGQGTAISIDGRRVMIGGYGFDSDKGYVQAFKTSISLPIKKLGNIEQLGSDLNGTLPGTQFGKAISLNQDGTIAAIGAPSGDLVQVFEWDAGTETWGQLGSDIAGEASGDQFGESLELSADGQILAVGAPLNGSSNGHVRILEWNDTSWVQKGSDIDGVDSGNESGTSVGLSEDGSTVIIGAPKRGNSGAAKVFEWDANTSDWIQKGSNLFGESSNDQFGLMVSTNTDGSIIAGTARLNDGNGTSAGHVRIFEWDNNNLDWVQKGSDIDGEAFGDDSGISADLSSDGLTVAIGARRNDGGGTNSGHVRVFEWDGNTSWVQKGGDIDGDFAEERLGISLSLDGAGNTLVIGSPESDASDTNPGTDRGEAKIFEWDADNSQWNQKGEDIDGVEPNANFGQGTAISKDGSTIMIGAYGFDSDNGYAQAFNASATTFENTETINYEENDTDIITDFEISNSNGDAADQGITYSISGGDDQALFSINAANGELTFKTFPDFENPKDADSNNDYHVVVTADDGSIQSIQTITVVIVDLADESPVFTSSEQSSVVENTYDVIVTVEAGSANYSIVGGDDQSFFTIDFSSGDLELSKGVDFENPGDTDGNNEYLVEVEADNGLFQSTQMITVTVTDATEDELLAVGTKDFQVDVPAQNNGFNTLAKSYFQIVYEKEELYAQTIYGLSFELYQNVTGLEGLDEWEIHITENSKEGFSGHTTSQFVTSNLTQVFDGTVVRDGRVVTVYFDQPYEFKGEGNLFIGVYDKSTGSVSGALWSGHYKGLASAGTMASIGVAVSSTSNINPASPANYFISGGADGLRPYTEFLYAQPSAPQFTSSSTPSVDENLGGVAIDVEAYDGDGGTADDGITYSLSGGADQALFSIDASNGQVSFNDSPDYENPEDQDGDNVYEIEVTADNGFVTATQNNLITVNNTNDERPQFTSSANLSVNENISGSIITLEATDADADSSLTYSLSGGADQEDFSLSGTELSFIITPDFENPADENKNNVYSIEVSASDGTNTTDYSMSITVLDDTNENSPEFTSSNSSTYAENGTEIIIDVNANDGDGGAEDLGITYSISGGTDQSLFTVDAASGELSFNSSPDFEDPMDDNEDNIYLLEVTANDGTDNSVQVISVSVTNENDILPVITSSTSFDIAENETMVQTLTASDADELGQLTFDITGGSDQFSFDLDENTGVLSFITAPDFENPQDQDEDNVYQVSVQVSDGSNGSSQTIEVMVTDENDNTPEFTSGNTVEIEENTISVITLEASDSDGGSTLSFSISGGADQGAFTVEAASGELSFNDEPDFEDPADANEDNQYEVIVSVSDGLNSSDQRLSITILDVDDTVTGIEEGISSISVYPNPTTNKFTVETEKAGIVKLFDLYGNLYSSHRTNQIIDLSHKKAGVYIMIISVDEKRTVRKIIKR